MILEQEGILTSGSAHCHSWRGSSSSGIVFTMYKDMELQMENTYDSRSGEIDGCAWFAMCLCK